MDPDQSLSSDQIKRYSRAFHRFDTDRDGNINGKDLGKILRYIGHNPTEAEIQEMIATADKDGTGTLDLIEFLQMMREKVKDQNKEEEIAEAFKVFDIVRYTRRITKRNLNTRKIFQDRNGYIDRRELGLMMKFMGEPVTQEEIDVRVDTLHRFLNLLNNIYRIFWMRRTRIRTV